MENNKFKLNDTLNTDNFGYCKIIAIYDLRVAYEPEGVESFVYGLMNLDDSAVYYLGEAEIITIRED